MCDVVNGGLGAGRRIDSIEQDADPETGALYDLIDVRQAPAGVRLGDTVRVCLGVSWDERYDQVECRHPGEGDRDRYHVMRIEAFAPMLLCPVNTILRLRRRTNRQEDESDR